MSDEKKSEPKKTTLPLLYNELTPISHKRHADYGVTAKRNFGFARDLVFIPLTMDEFPQAQRDYPIVFTTKGPTVPVALLGSQAGGNQFVEEDGSWRKGAYVPGYLRRYPFQMIREKEGSDRFVFCADLTSDLLEADCKDQDRRLFDGEKPGKTSETAMEFCKAYEAALVRTRKAIAELEALKLIDESSVNLKNGEKTARIDGFSVVDEAKLRELSDETISSLVKRGVMGCVYAHLFSMGNFAKLAIHGSAKAA